MPAKVLFRVDFGGPIGLGHLRRCLSLAAALKSASVETFFLTNRSITRELREETFPGETLSGVVPWSKEDARTALETAVRSGCQAILVDSHEAKEEYLAALRAAGQFVIARDDLADYPFPCQMVFNGNADAGNRRYESSSGDTRFFLGPEYAVLPPAFWGKSVRRTTRKMAKNLLLVLGGADAGRAMPRLISLLNKIPGDFSVTAVIGPLCEHPEEINAAVKRASKTVGILRNPGTGLLMDSMLQADLAVSAAGQTLYELAWAGCPTVAVRMAPNQAGQLRALAEANVVWPGGSAEKDADFSGVQSAVRKLLSEPAERAAMSEVGQALIDGKGALRAAEAISQEVARHARA